MPALVPVPPFPDEALPRLEEEFHRVKGSVSDSYGHIYFKHGAVYAVAPWGTPDDLAEPPILFLDESRDEVTSTFLYGGLILTGTMMFRFVLQHIRNLVTVRDRYPGVWPRDKPAPRLHLKDFGQLRTHWGQAPKDEVRTLWAATVEGVVRCVVAKPLIMPLVTPTMREAVALVFPAREVEPEIPDLALQMAALQMRVALHESVDSTATLEVIADYDVTKVKVGPGRRQATLRFLELLLARPTHPLDRPMLVRDERKRPASSFPDNFSFDALCSTGYPIHPLVEALGLQLVDLYVGTWRQLEYRGSSSLGITKGQLGSPVLVPVDWWDGRNVP